MRFTGYASNEWPYMYHFHMLRHEDQGMMGQFVIVEPGQSTNTSDYRLGSDQGHGSHGG